MMNVDRLKAQYLAFCASPLRTERDIITDFEHLCRNPAVTHLVFHKPYILAIGTSPLIIEHERCSYKIGELIIFFIRKRIGRVWETAFFVANPTGALPDEEDPIGEKGRYIHPHILLCDYSDITFPVGELCISSGQFVIYQSLRKGIISRAFAHLWAALHVYGTGQPFLSVCHWPQIREE